MLQKNDVAEDTFGALQALNSTRHVAEDTMGALNALNSDLNNDN